MSSTITFAPHQPSPLTRTISPFKHPRAPPSTPSNTAKIWDEYERLAVESAKGRETTYTSTSCQASQSVGLSTGTKRGAVKSYDSHFTPKKSSSMTSSSVTASSPFDFGFSTPKTTTPRASAATVAICKTCKQPITSSPGICERCKKTIILPSVSGETTPPLSPLARNFASADLQSLQQFHKTSKSRSPTPNSSPTSRKSHGPPSTQLVEPPIRLSSLRPPPSLQTTTPRSSTEVERPRKASLTDPNDAFPRLQISRKPVPLSATHPPTPTTPPSTSQSHHSAPRTRPSSLANITTPPTKSYPSTRHNSATPSELSTLYPYISSSSTTTSPPSVYRASYQLQNTTSAWDSWDSEDEEEKVGLVSYWRGRKWRGSRGSLGGQGSSTGRRDSSSKEEPLSSSKERRKRRGFVRVISCGGCAED